MDRIFKSANILVKSLEETELLTPDLSDMMFLCKIAEKWIHVYKEEKYFFN